ncbi:MAG TPA: hypothetical protein VEA61_11865 [Allosphingosinicella sp.]|nr:hypothetical protein [Allosphingosinicella sp.]
MTYVPAGLTLLALTIVAVGFRFSRSSRRPTLLRGGAVTTAFGLILLWLLPFSVFRVDTGLWAMPIFVAALLAAGSVLGLGLQLMARACGEQEDSRNDTLFDDFVRHNELP